MPNYYVERLRGPIKGLRLPLIAWNRLKAEGITTLDQLKAVADELEYLNRVGPKTARTIREELSRLEASEEQPSDRPKT
jgi:DNA-directed RNA polymerase alpha subunit